MSRVRVLESVRFVSPRQLRKVKKPMTVFLAMTAVTAGLFAYFFAIPYLMMDIEHFGIYRPRRDWLIAHIAGGVTALLIGPIQFWLTVRRRNALLHGLLGTAYVIGVAVGTASAFYLARHNDFGWVFGLGLGSMAVAWMLSTALAVTAIAKRLVEQHREWMIRSYAVTFGFVWFRILVEVLQVARVGSIVEQLTLASWLCWSVPLMLTEVIMQGRKILQAVAVRPALPGDVFFTRNMMPQPTNQPINDPTNVPNMR